MENDSFYINSKPILNATVVSKGISTWPGITKTSTFATYAWYIVYTFDDYRSEKAVCKLTRWLFFLSNTTWYARVTRTVYFIIEPPVKKQKKPDHWSTRSSTITYNLDCARTKSPFYHSFSDMFTENMTFPRVSPFVCRVTTDGRRFVLYTWRRIWTLKFPMFRADCT